MPARSDQNATTAKCLMHVIYKQSSQTNGGFTEIRHSMQDQNTCFANSANLLGVTI